MIELWTAIGMAVCDDEFNGELQKVRKIRREKAALKKLLELMRKKCFRLSCYELAELLRIISTPKVLEMMAEIHGRIWFIETPCLWDWCEDVFEKEYQHPYLAYDNLTKKNVTARVYPLTGEPVYNEPLAAKGQGVTSEGRMQKPRFEKPKATKAANVTKKSSPAKKK